MPVNNIASWYASTMQAAGRVHQPSHLGLSDLYMAPNLAQYPSRTFYCRTTLSPGHRRHVLGQAAGDPCLVVPTAVQHVQKVVQIAYSRRIDMSVPASDPFAHPRVGVAAVISRRGKVLVGLRKGSHGSGTLQLPGGHLEFGESFETCVEREALEETNLKVKGVKVLGVTNDIFDAEGRHYVTVFVGCEVLDDAEPEVLEPTKCSWWQWKTWDEIRAFGTREGEAELFIPLRHFLEECPPESLF
ncbi:Nudix hydrolase 1 [Colletotrichum orbiculare MAFF 240422]|uniref:Nudix hydrolase 1 n=1 Tax=Colletotrichum orbiculare (strain 104-T / ATCC 96160 / CBS 514.97 / LARS 414 / MAFF 240422) TaxID=1213857 RepID=A0A484FD53_COLOR|nr:Nudix hydrolase 1 [Colletotrichum orbiculare MAFF 240422]